MKNRILRLPSILQAQQRVLPHGDEGMVPPPGAPTLSCSASCHAREAHCPTRPTMPPTPAALSTTPCSSPFLGVPVLYAEGPLLAPLPTVPGPRQGRVHHVGIWMQLSGGPNTTQTPTLCYPYPYLIPCAHPVPPRPGLRGQRWPVPHGGSPWTARMSTARCFIQAAIKHIQVTCQSKTEPQVQPFASPCWIGSFHSDKLKAPPAVIEGCHRRAQLPWAAWAGEAAGPRGGHALRRLQHPSSAGAP